MTDGGAPPSSVSAQTRARLSPGDLQLLQLIADALTNAEIARYLGGVSDETVKTQVRRVMRKLDARNRVDAAMKAVRLGVVVLDDLPIEFPKGLAALGPRETQVLGFLCLGLSQRQIADRLGLARETVRGLTQAIRTSWHVHSTAEIVQLARENGLVTGPSRLAPSSSS